MANAKLPRHESHEVVKANKEFPAARPLPDRISLLREEFRSKDT